MSACLLYNYGILVLETFLLGFVFEQQSEEEAAFLLSYKIRQQKKGLPLIYFEWLSRARIAYMND